MPTITTNRAGKPPKSYLLPLERELVTLGGGKENDVPIDCDSTSVKHAQMRRVKSGYELLDSGSTNGTKFVASDWPIQPSRLPGPVNLIPISIE